MAISFLAKYAARYKLDVDLHMMGPDDLEEAFDIVDVYMKYLLKLRGLSGIWVGWLWDEGQIDLTEEFENYVHDTVMLPSGHEAVSFEVDKFIGNIDEYDSQFNLIESQNRTRF